MPKALFKVSRKPIELVNLASDKEVAAEFERKKRTGAYLLKQRGHHLVSGSLRPLSRFSVSEVASTRSIPRNFSSSALSDYVCNLVDTRLVGAAHGRIDQLLLAVPPNLDRRRNIIFDPPVEASDERHLRTLIGLMDGHTKFILLCHSHQIETVESWLVDLGISAARVSICLSVFLYTIWAQDAYVNLTDQQAEPILCEGVNFPRYDDMSIADDVGAQTEVRTLQSYLYFQGGNVLATKEFALVGADYVKKNIGRAHLETTSKVLDRFSQLFGMPTISLGRQEPIPREHRANDDGSVIYLSGLYQPLFHIDMYVTPTGVFTESGKEVVLVGRPAKARDLLNEPPGEFDFDQYFEEAQEQLDQHFKVVELPLYPVVQGNRHYHLTYNNAVLENYIDSGGQRKRVVYMPTFAQDADDYGLPRGPREALDNAAESIWSSLGYEVRRMDGLEDLAYGWGSVHCITKDLLRSAYEVTSG